MADIAGGNPSLEERLRDSEEQYRLLAQTASDALFTIDEHSTIVFASAAVEKTFGYKPGELIGQKLTVLMPERFRGGHGAGLARYLSTGQKNINWGGVELPGLHRDGYEVPLEISFGEFIKQGQRYFTGVARNIAQRKLHEAQLREAEQRFRIMADTAPVLIWMSGTDRKCGFFNKSWLEFTGRSLERECGSGWLDGVHPEDVGRCLRSYHTAFDIRNEFKMEFRLRRADGEYRWLLEHGVPRFSPGGTFEGFIGSCIDIHDRHRNELREKTARIEAENVSRMKDEFLASLSHELRTPLTPILGWTRLLKMGKLRPEDALHAVDVIERSVKTQAKLIEDLLDVSRIITGKIKLELAPVGLAQVIEAAMDVVRPTAEAKGITLRFVMESSAGPILGDAARLQQVVWNLLNNAVKFSETGGTIDINLRRDESTAVIKVSDTGEGISAAYLPYVFERFSQADNTTTRKHGGLGIGLSIVRHLSELHGGRVQAASPGLGQGATFTVRLPIPSVITPRGAEQYPLGNLLEPHGVPATLNGVRVLVVDDEADARDFLSFSLSKWGANVTLADSADAAIKIFTTAVPDVVISDIGMPGEDGYAFIARLRAIDRKVPAIALTAYARAEDRARALAAGYQQHIAKPVEPVELALTVAGLLRNTA